MSNSHPSLLPPSHPIVGGKGDGKGGGKGYRYAPIKPPKDKKFLEDPKDYFKKLNIHFTLQTCCRTFPFKIQLMLNMYFVCNKSAFHITFSDTHFRIKPSFEVFVTFQCAKKFYFLLSKKLLK